MMIKKIGVATARYHYRLADIGQNDMILKISRQ